MTKKRLRQIKYMRRFVFVLIAVLLLLLGMVKCAKHRHEKKAEAQTAVTTTSMATTTVFTTAQATVTVTTTTVPKINSPQCRSAAVYSMETEEMMYADNIDARTAPASLTKLLTASVALKYVDPKMVCTVGTEQYFVQPYSSLSYIDLGNQLTMNDLITGMLMASGNDAAYTIAVSTAREVSGNEYMEDSEAIEYFCKLMNDLAKEIGMKNSHFTTPDGWDENDQYTTAADLIKLAEYAIKDPTIQQIVSTHEKDVVFETGEPVTWTNSNLLIDPYSDYFCQNAVGMKTGTTLDAGNSLIAAFVKGGKKYITVVEGCDTDEDRYELTLKLYSEVIDK